MAAVGEADASAVAAAGSVEYPTLLGVPPEAFPLFTSAHKFLTMLDGSLPDPFLPRCGCSEALAHSRPLCPHRAPTCDAHCV